MPIQICPNTVVWGDVATWVSALITCGAVVIAALAIRGDNQRQHRLQNAEWDRADKRTKELTGRLAMAIAKELYRARVEIKALLACMASLNGNAKTMTSFRTTFRLGLDLDQLFLMERLVDDLAGFAPMHHVAILNAISLWKSEQMFKPGFFDPIEDQWFLAHRDELMAHLNATIEVYAALEADLQEYFKEMPNLIWMTEAEVRSANAAKPGSV
jgi:hypothetical protein